MLAWSRILLGVGVGLLMSWEAWAWGTDSVRCDEHLDVIGSTVRFETQRYQGRAIRKDAYIEVTLKSTSTLAVGAIELGVFLGASLDELRSSRPAVLPGRDFRELKSGGVAFRAEVEAFVPANATRKLTFKKSALPTSREFLGVNVVIADCRWLRLVGRDAQVVRPREKPTPLGWIVAGMVMMVALAISVLWRLR